MEEIITVKLASRKRRFLAFVIDILLISLTGYLSTFFLENFYMKLGNYGKLIGAFIVLIYFGIFDSTIGNGQSIGKKILKIKVVNRKSEGISVLYGYLRALWLFAWILLNGFSLSNSKYIPLLIVCGTILFSIVLLEIYFFIFNKKTIQSFHDLLLNTFVVSTDSKGEIEYKNNNKILYCSIIIPILILSITTCLNIRAKDTVLGDYLKIIDIIQEDIPVHQTTISKNFSVVKISKETIHNDYVVLSTYKNNKSDDDKEIAVKIAQKVFDSDFIIDENEIFSIEINSGFNIGIASKNKNQRFNGTVEHWKYEIEQLEK